MDDQGQPARKADDMGETVQGSAPDFPVNVGDVGDIAACCVGTIREHVQFNPMMVCIDCKHIIKCFKDRRSFQNYLTFCKSRRRPVVTGFIEGQYTVAFKSYDTTFAR